MFMHIFSVVEILEKLPIFNFGNSKKYDIILQYNTFAGRNTIFTKLLVLLRPNFKDYHHINKPCFRTILGSISTTSGK